MSASGGTTTYERIEQEVLDDALDRLHQLSRGTVAAEDVLAGLRARHPDHLFHLIADRESYDGSVHHDIVVRHTGAPAVSLSVAAPTGLPWPLRGVQRVRDGELLEVNGRAVGVAEAMARIDLFTDREAMRMLIDGCLLSDELERDPVNLDGDDIQAAADAFRRAKGLTGAARTRAWLTDRGLTAEDFALLVTRQAEFAALRRRRTDADVDGWLDARGGELDELVLAWTDTDDVDPEQALRAGAYEAVDRALRTGRRAGISRHAVADLGPAASAAEPGEVIALELEVPGVAIVLDRCSPTDHRRQELAADRILRDQLTMERQAARITWFWGEGEDAR
jgi:putative peptide maturation system protein